MAHTIQHHPSLHRFLCQVPEGLAFLEYEPQTGAMDITHTFVPPAARGQGLAEALMEACLAHAKAQNLKVIPTCSYAARYLQRKQAAT